MRAQTDGGLEAFERAAAHARQAGLPHESVGWRAALRFFGTTPPGAGAAWCVAFTGAGSDRAHGILEPYAELTSSGDQLEYAKRLASTTIPLRPARLTVP
jgi:hypothetical protein